MSAPPLLVSVVGPKLPVPLKPSRHIVIAGAVHGDGFANISIRPSKVCHPPGLLSPKEVAGGIQLAYEDVKSRASDDVDCPEAGGFHEFSFVT